EIGEGAASNLKEDLAPFEEDDETPDLFFHVHRTERSPGKGIHPGLARAIWAPMHRFPFEDRADFWLGSRLKSLAAFIGNPEVKAVFRKAESLGWDRVLLIPSSLGPAVFFPQEGRAEVFLAQAEQRLTYGHLTAVLFQVLSTALAERGGLLVHGAGIVREGRGYAFLGLSGAGKSTVAVLSQGALLADDGLILRQGKEGFRIFATPFCQLRKENSWEKGVALGSAPLEGLIFLEKGAEHGLRPLAKPEAASILLQQLIHYFRLFPDGAAEKGFHTVVDLVERVSPKRLQFKKDAGFWDLIE
ncbi:MAG: hypothetical protein ACYTHN_24545, partial [Planctomycetota bacterium]